MNSGFWRSVKKTTFVSKIKFRFSMFLLLALLLAAGLPSDPFSTILGTRKITISQQPLLLPSTSLSQSVAVNPCSETALNSLYDTAANFRVASSGLSVFRARLKKEYSQGLKSLRPLALEILATKPVSSTQSKTCLIPLKISANSNLGKDIASSQLLEVSLGAESVLCSQSKAYLSSDANSSSLYSVTQALKSYSDNIKNNRIIVDLKRALLKLQYSKSGKSRAELEQINKKIREVTLAIAYADFFLKDALILGSFFDAVCSQAAAVTTATPAVSILTATPVVATSTHTATPVVPTATQTSIASATNTSTPVPPTVTRTATSTKTSTPNVPTVVPPTNTRTATATSTPTPRVPTVVPATKTATATKSPTPVIPTATSTSTATRTSTPVVPTSTATRTSTPIAPTASPTTIPSVSGSCSSVSQFGITWTFDTRYSCGQFANGDWWVIGPIKINSISPGATARPSGSKAKSFDISGYDMNGSMIGPDSPKGWDIVQGMDAVSNIESAGSYDSALNIAKKLPYTVPANKSVISSIGKTNPSDQRAFIETQAVLTVLSSVPAAGSFRPSYFGSNKAIKWNKNQINYSKLKKVLSPALFNISEVESSFAKPIIILGGKDSNYKFENLIASGNSPYFASAYVYGRDVSFGTARGGLALNSNLTDAQKETLAINYIQFGLDVYSGVALGNTFDANEGHVNGYKLPMVVAGVLLNDPDIIAKSNGNLDIFSEDQQHFYVSQNDVNTVRINATSAGQTGCRTKNNPCDRPVEAYTSAMIGTPEWGGKGSNNEAGSQWGIIYRDVAGPNLLGTALVAEIMGIENIWNKPEFFEYNNKRAWPNFSAQGNVNGLISSAWTAVK